MAYQSVPGQFNPVSSSFNYTPSSSPALQSIPGQYNYVSKNYNTSTGSPVMQSIPGQYNPVSHDYNASLNKQSSQDTGGQALGATTGPANNYGFGADNLSGRANGANVGDIRNGYRWNGQFWEPSSPVQQVSPSDIDNAYNEANGFYDQMYNQELGNKDNFLKQYTDLYDAQRPGLDTAYQQGSNLNQQQQNQTYQQEQSALDNAKSLYNELQQGVQQRFGQTNSAGDFAKAFYGREFQKNMGNIQNTTGQNINSLLTQQNNLYSQYQANLKELEGKKAAALSQAQDVFQQRLDAINNAKGQMAQNKAQMKLQALQDYKNTLNAVSQQATQFAQSLFAQHQAASDQFKNQIALYANLYNKPQMLQSLPGISTAGPISQQGAAGTYNPTGYVDYSTRRDQYGNPIYQ